MVATSTIPAYRAALIALLQARTGLAGVAVTDGPPAPAVLAGQKFLALQEAKGRQAVRAMGRNQPREERFTQTVEISVVAETRFDQVTIGNEVFSILAELEDAIRTNSTLVGYYAGPGAIYSQILGSEDYQTFADDAQRESRLTVGVDVHSRL